jgi:hypothetical protein
MFSEFEDGILKFTRLDGSLIRKIKIGSVYSFYDKDVTSLFKQDKIIRVYLPIGYTARIIYKFKDGKGFAETIDLEHGAHDIKMERGDNKIIDQIEAKSISGLNIIPNQKIIVTNSNGARPGLPGPTASRDIIYSFNNEDQIDWNLIYTDYGLDNYYVVSPWGRRLFYYTDYPTYRRYRPSRYYRKKYLRGARHPRHKGRKVIVK